MSGDRREPDWSLIPPDLIHLISKKLQDASDLVCFRAVCKVWRSSAAVSRSFPWLLEYQNPNGTELRFYSLSSDRIHTIRVPESRDKSLVTVSNSSGYLLARRRSDSSLSLLNPLTRNVVSLPLNFIPRSLIVNPNATVSGDPNRSGEYYIVLSSSVIHSRRDGTRTRLLGFLQPGQKNLRGIQVPYVAHRYAIYKGMYLVEDENSGDTLIVDTSTGATLHMIPPPEIPSSRPEIYDVCSCYYLVDCFGDLLKVLRIYFQESHNSFSFDKSFFEIYRFEYEHEVPQWVRISNIGDQFLCLSGRCFSYRASDFTRLRPNCIYFLNFHSAMAYNKSRKYVPTDKYSLCRYDIERERDEEIPSSIENGGNWMVASII